jgi:hypothetical protein
MSRRYPRRTVLTASLAGIGALAGCSGSDSENDTTGGNADESPDESTEGTESEADGDGALSVTVEVNDNDFNAISDYESFVVSFDRLVFHSQSGDTVTVSIGQEIDLVEITDRDPQTYADSVTFPAGTYTTVDVHMPIVSTTMNDGSESTRTFTTESPREVDLEILDSYLSGGPGGSLRFSLTPGIRQTFDGESWELQLNPGYGTY